MQITDNSFLYSTLFIKNINTESFKPYVLNYLHECNESENIEYKFKNIHTRKNLVICDVYYIDKMYKYNYLDDHLHVRKFCQYIAEDFREITGKSVYFDMKDGKMVIVT